MPILPGSVTVQGLQQVSQPWETKVKQILQLMDQTVEQQINDKRFLRNGKPAIIAGPELQVLNTCLSTVSEVLSFVGGPAGIAFASGLVIFQGLLSIATQSGPTDALTNMEIAVKTIQYQKETSDQLTKVRAIANTINTQWREVVDDLDSGSEHQKKIVDGQLTSETGTQAGSLGLTLFGMEELMQLDDTTARISVLASLTYLFVVWNLQCRIYASLMRIEAAKHPVDLERYNDFATTLRLRVDEMKNELKTRTAALQTKYQTMIAERVAEVTWIGVQTQNAPTFADNNDVTTYVKYTDKYTGQEYSTTVPTDWFSGSASSVDINKIENDKKCEFESYKIDLTNFVTRAIANDLAVVNQCASIVGEAEELLQFPAPKMQPLLDHYEPADPSKLNKYLEDANWVSYAYSVGISQDDTSALSPWTEWLEIIYEKNGQIKLPAIVLQNSGLASRCSVYHRKCIDDHIPSVHPDPTILGATLDELMSEVVIVEGTVLWIEPEKIK